MLQKHSFENPEKKSLDELFFFVKEDGVQLKVAALSQRWVKPRCYTKYQKLIIRDDHLPDTATLDEWLNEAQWFNKDLEFLLSLEHFRFWSHIVYEKQCMEIIVCFLQEAIPHYLPIKSITSNENIITTYSKILQNVLRIICRMITNKESDEAWITKEHLGELLYSKFLISVPMMFDMIIAYGKKNAEILSKIIKTIFKIEPKYNEDLNVAIRFLQKTFHVIKQKTEGVDDEKETATTFDDLALYTLDCSSTLSILLEIYPESKTICSEVKLEQSITKFYDNVIPLLYKNIYLINDSSKSLTYLNQARLELLNAFRSLIYLHIENILKEPENSLIPAENFIGILTECLADRTFVLDYQKHYPVENDIDILQQACKDLDFFKTDFVLKGYTSKEESESYLLDLLEKNDIKDITESDFEIEKLQELTENGFDEDGACRNISGEVSYVLDILPHLGDGFVRRLLLRYDSPNAVISAVLENNLPPDLKDADQQEVYIPPDPQDTFYMQTGIQRYNVYDGDEYDILSRDNPDCIIKSKKGFPGQPRNATQLLNDKSYVKEMKEHYQHYSIVEDDQYDDEYDDSYEAIMESEAKTTKSNAMKNVIIDEVDTESEEDEEDKDDRDKSKDFCQNPEDIRAKYEASRNAKFGRQKATQKSTDVVGKAKGQGQDKETVINRHKKETHKSSRANHNRKSGASWKRNRGMIPS